MYLKIIHSARYCFVGVFVGLILSGCFGSKLNSGEREKLPIPLEITLGALENVNPTDDGRASPVVVRVFELANDSRFQVADYFELMAQGPVSLDGDVLSTEEHILIPGEVRVVRKRAALEGKYLGIVAGYRNTSSVWRAITPLPEPYLAGRLWTKSVSPTVRLYVVLDKGGVVIHEEGSPK